MKKEITKVSKIEIEEVESNDNSKRLFILYVDGVDVDRIIIDILHKQIILPFKYPLGVLLDICLDSYDTYVEFLEGQGFKMNTKKTHWTPKNNGTYYFYHIFRDIVSSEVKGGTRHSDENLISNYFAFPTKELVDRCKDMGKLERLQVLYQYENDMLFVPNWYDNSQSKYCICTEVDGIGIDYTRAFKTQCVYWENTDELEEFIGVYKEEIKELLSR